MNLRDLDTMESKCIDPNFQKLQTDQNLMDAPNCHYGTLLHTLMNFSEQWTPGFP